MGLAANFPTFDLAYIDSKLGGGNSKIFYFHPETWGRFSPILTVRIFLQRGWFNHQFDYPQGNDHISPQRLHFEDDVPFPKVGYVSSLEGIYYVYGMFYPNLPTFDLA